MGETVGGARRLRPPIARRSPVVGVGVAVAAGLILWQLGRLLLASLHQYHRFNLSLDFALFHQAWFQIAHGHLNPRNTVNPTVPAFPYWKSHFELIMWPLSLLYWLNRNDGLTLLGIQDVAIVVAEATGLWWMLAVAKTRQVPAALLAGALVATAYLAFRDPWLYSGAQQDFHFEAVAACFGLLAAYQLWAERRGWCWVFVALTLCCGDVAGTYVAGIGLAFACTTPRVRRQALAVLAAGIGWVVLVALIGANQGSQIGTYGYLSLHHPLPSGARGAASIVAGMVVHPSRPVHQINHSWVQIGRLVGPTGWLGVINPWTWGAVIVTLVANVLSSARVFRNPTFQNFAVYLFSTAGTGLFLVAAAARSVWRIALTLVLTVGVVVSALIFDAGHHQFLLYRASIETGAELQQVRNHIPASAEVITTFGIVGRFAGRPSVHTFIRGGTKIPINEPDVIVVLAPSTGNQPTPGPVLDELGTLLTTHLHAQIIWDGPTVIAYQWHPTINQHTLTIPR